MKHLVVRRSHTSNMIKKLYTHEDPVLIKAVLGGNNQAFRVLAERYHGLIYSAVRGILGDHQEVDETVQNAIIKIYRGLSRFRGDAKFSSWVYRIARNESLTTLSKQRTNQVSLSCIADLGHRQDDAEAAYWQQVTDRNLEAAMAGISEKHRMVLELRYMGEKSYLEIADILELPIGTVKTMIHRAKAELRTELERRQLKATG